MSYTYPPIVDSSIYNSNFYTDTMATSQSLVGGGGGGTGDTYVHPDDITLNSVNTGTLTVTGVTTLNNGIVEENIDYQTVLVNSTPYTIIDPSRHYICTTGSDVIVLNPISDKYTEISFTNKSGSVVTLVRSGTDTINGLLNININIDKNLELRSIINTISGEAVNNWESDIDTPLVIPDPLTLNTINIEKSISYQTFAISTTPYTIPDAGYYRSYILVEGSSVIYLPLIVDRYIELTFFNYGESGVILNRSGTNSINGSTTLVISPESELVLRSSLNNTSGDLYGEWQVNESYVLPNPLNVTTVNADVGVINELSSTVHNNYQTISTGNTIFNNNYVTVSPYVIDGSVSGGTIIAPKRKSRFLFLDPGASQITLGLIENAFEQITIKNQSGGSCNIIAATGNTIFGTSSHVISNNETLRIESINTDWVNSIPEPVFPSFRISSYESIATSGSTYNLPFNAANKMTIITGAIDTIQLGGTYLNYEEFEIVNYTSGALLILPHVNFPLISVNSLTSIQVNGGCTVKQVQTGVATYNHLLLGALQ